MILKKLQTGATTVIVTKKEYDEYISQGYTYIEDVEVAMNIDEAEEENIRFKLDGTSLYWKYESDFNWTLFAGGGGGTSTSKVKVNASDSTEQYLSDKLVADIGTEISVVDTAGVKTLKFKSKANIPAYNVANAYKLGDTVEYTDSKEYRANADIPANTAWAIGTTGATWKLVGGGSDGGSGVTVYADLAAIKAVDTTAYTTVQTVQVANLGLYKFKPASTLTGDNVNVITPTTGSSAGRWIKQSIDIEEVASNINYPWSDKIQEPRLNGKKIKLATPDGLNKKILAIGSSVMLGYCAAVNLEIGKTYTIYQPGTTTWTTLGAANNNMGTTFTATAKGTGDGTAKLNNAYPEQLVAKINTLDSGWTVINNSSPGNTSQGVFDRLWIDGLKNNPGVVIIGVCPNNDGLDTSITLGTISTVISNFRKGTDKIIKACQENGLPWYVVGVYPKSTYTALPYDAEKKLNIALQKIYGKRYINVYNVLDNGSGRIKTAYDTGDGTHLNYAGNTVIADAFPVDLVEKDPVILDGLTYSKGAGIILGSDTTTATPILSTVGQNMEAHTVGFDFKPNTIQSACVLGYLGGNKEINLNIDSNGFIGLFIGTTQIITTTTKPVAGWNRVRLTFTRDTTIYKLYLNKTLIGTSTAQNQYLSTFGIGGGLTPANNAVGVEFRNLVHWTTALSAEEIIDDFNNDISKSCLSFFNPLNTSPVSIYENYAITTTRRLLVNSSLWTLGTNEMDNIFTNTEKTKIANSLNGTFTTADGKTITITGGMVTSIV